MLFVEFRSFFLTFTHFFVEFCRDRHSRTFPKISKILASSLFSFPCLSQILSSTPVQGLPAVLGTQKSRSWMCTSTMWHVQKCIFFAQIIPSQVKELQRSLEKVKSDLTKAENSRWADIFLCALHTISSFIPGRNVRWSSKMHWIRTRHFRRW